MKPVYMSITTSFKMNLTLKDYLMLACKILQLELTIPIQLVLRKTHTNSLYSLLLKISTVLLICIKLSLTIFYLFLILLFTNSIILLYASKSVVINQKLLIVCENIFKKNGKKYIKFFVYIVVRKRFILVISTFIYYRLQEAWIFF